MKLGMTFEIKETNVMGPNVSTPPSVSIVNVVLDMADRFTAVKAKLNNIERQLTKLKVSQARVIDTLLYQNKTWIKCARKDSHLERFHFRYRRRILGITWRVKLTNSAVLKKQTP